LLKILEVGERDEREKGKVKKTKKPIVKKQDYQV
jgi:hypothetical protein